MARVSFFVNNLKVTKKRDYLVLEAQKKFLHGKILDEVFLTLPSQLGHLFASIEGTHDQTMSGEGFNEAGRLIERFKRLSNGN